MAGIRDAQVEQPNPEIKKNIAAPILNCEGVLFVDSSATKFIKQLKYDEKVKAERQKQKDTWIIKLLAMCFLLSAKKAHLKKDIESTSDFLNKNLSLQQEPFL